MIGIVGRLFVLGALLATAAPALAASTNGGFSPTQLAANAFQTNRWQHLVCVISHGSSPPTQCDVKQTGPEFQVGMPCYCGNSPKGRIRSVPLEFAPVQ